MFRRLSLVAPAAVILLLTACNRAPDPAPPPERSAVPDGGDLAAQLAGDPEALADLRRRCRADREAIGADTCDAVARATRLRFMGKGPSAYAPGVVSGETGGAPSNAAR